MPQHRQVPTTTATARAAPPPPMPLAARTSSKMEEPKAPMAHLVAHMLSCLRFLFARALHIGMLIVCCMAYAGPGAEDDEPHPVPEPMIRFPPLPAKIQQVEIALAVLCLVLDPILSVYYFMLSSRVMARSEKAQPSRLKHMLLYAMGPLNIALLAGWLACIVYQSRYVPIRGSRELELCSSGQGVTQCRMVDASWILAMIFCADHVLVVLYCVMTLISLPKNHLAYGFRREKA